MAILDWIASISLSFTRVYLIAFIMIIGYVIFDREKYAQLFIIFSFGCILNLYLKSIWRVPLPPELGFGWAFPSGHMNFGMLFWGWLAWRSGNRKWMLACAVLLAGIGFGLVHRGYHHWIDVFGAMGSATLQLAAFHWIFIKKQADVSWVGLVLGAIALVLIYLVAERAHFPFLWFYEGTIIGIAVGYYAFRRIKYAEVLKGDKAKSIEVALAIIGFLSVSLCIKTKTSPPNVILLSYLGSALWISVGSHMATRWLLKK